MATPAGTVNWVKNWGLSSDATGTSSGFTMGQRDYTIAENNGYTQKMLMSVKKVTTNSQTQLWWGYTAQLSMATPLTQTN